MIFSFAAKWTLVQFYASDGLIRVRLGRALSPKGAPTAEEEGDSAGHKNVNQLLDSRFGQARPSYCHASSLCPQ